MRYPAIVRLWHMVLMLTETLPAEGLMSSLTRVQSGLDTPPPKEPFKPQANYL